MPYAAVAYGIRCKQVLGYRQTIFFKQAMCCYPLDGLLLILFTSVIPTCLLMHPG